MIFKEEYSLHPQTLVDDDDGIAEVNLPVAVHVTKREEERGPL